jgi:hypothetical protein
MRKQIKAHPRITILILFLIALAATILIGGYRLNWAWTGFTGDKETYRTLYDWLQLLIIPVVIAVAGYAINLTISRSEQDATERRANTDRYLAQTNADVEREIAYENQQNEAVKSYIDDISQLILHDDLPEVLDTKNPARLIARIRTLTMLARLDSIRKRMVLHFLSESSLLLIYNGNSIVDLYGANLFEADLQSINLRCQNLKGVYLDGANLQDAILKNCNSRGARISEANLKRADLREALLYYSDLTYSDLREADLTGAYLVGADIRDANMTGADLSNADMTDADLAGAIVTDEQLAKAKSLKGARMRDRTRNP